MRSIFKVALVICGVILVLACANPAQEHLEQGSAYREQGRFDKAIAEYTKAIEADPNLALAYNNRGCVYSWKKDYERAIADFNKAIELDPQRATAYLNRAQLYVGNAEEDKAIADLKKVLQLSQDPSEIQMAEGLMEILRASESN